MSINKGAILTESDIQSRVKDAFDKTIAVFPSDSLVQECIEFWTDEFLEAAAIEEGVDVDMLSEMSQRKAGLIGAAIGGAIGGPAGVGIGLKLAAVGGILGSTLAKGKQRTLQDQIDSANKKIQKWKKDPEENKEKIIRLESKTREWQKLLDSLVASGKGKNGELRLSHEVTQAIRAKRAAKNSEK